MYPLAKVNLEDYQPESFINPLWDTEAKMAMKVYLSTKPNYDENFLKSEFEPVTPEGEEEVETKPKDIVLLWEEPVNSASLSKTFLISSLDCIDSDDSCDTENIDSSLQFAREWLDSQDKAMQEDDGSILSTIHSAAGQGIESTSILLTIGQGIANKLNSLLVTIGLTEEKDGSEKNDNKGILARSNVHLPASSPIWSSLMNNSTIYVHVVLVREKFALDNPTFQESYMALSKASQTHSLLLGKVDLVKYDTPTHLGKPNRILLWDLDYLFRKYVLMDPKFSQQRPPWDMEVTKPEYFEAYQKLQQMKAEGLRFPYWKPEVAVKYLIDEESYPMDIAHRSGMDFVRVQKTRSHPSGIAHIPALHVDEIGLTSEKYMPINGTVTSLPLRISFDRSDIEGEGQAQTATAGGISPARWRLLTHLSSSIESQKELGFEQSDIDDLRRLIADTNVTLLGITVLASALHMLFEFLTFKSEVSFWQNNSDLTGLSVRSLFLDMIGQFIILLYLIEQETSMLITITTLFGLLVALWKCQRAAGFALVRLSDADKKAKPSVINIVPRMFGYQFKAKRLESSSAKTGDDKSSDDSDNKSSQLHAFTLEADRQATIYLGSAMLPLVVGYTIYSLIQHEHVSWYSWLVTSASSGVYAGGFVLMTPQLFLNYKMKSVAHLPWRVLVYKSLNTFIDDLFSFIIRMPTMARISCFRDDVVFFIYLYQRWLYPVDTSRPVEGGGEAANEVSDSKKNQ